MGNRLFQEAREFVENVLHSGRDEDHEKMVDTAKNELSSAVVSSTDEDYGKMVDVAKNALSSAFANSTDAEKVQLRELQEKLENHLK